MTLGTLYSRSQTPFGNGHPRNFVSRVATHGFEHSIARRETEFLERAFPNGVWERGMYGVWERGGMSLSLKAGATDCWLPAVVDRLG